MRGDSPFWLQNEIETPKPGAERARFNHKNFTLDDWPGGAFMGVSRKNHIEFGHLTRDASRDGQPRMGKRDNQVRVFALSQPLNIWGTPLRIVSAPYLQSCSMISSYQKNSGPLSRCLAV